MRTISPTRAAVLTSWLLLVMCVLWAVAQG
jgi:hypothetical protein